MGFPANALTAYAPHCVAKRPHLLPLSLHSLINTNARTLDVLVDAALEYRMHLLGSDDTGKAEFTLLRRVAQDIVGLSPQQAIFNNCPSDIQVTNLALASVQISHTPPELADVVSSKYKFLIYVTANSFCGRWATGHHSMFSLLKLTIHLNEG